MSRYKMLAREDFDLYLRDVGVTLERERKRMYHALDVLPVSDFEARDALNHEIAASIGEQRALRRIADWVAQQCPRDGEPMSTEALMELQNRIAAANQ